MSEDLDEVAREVDRSARKVDGVEDVYSARPLLSRAARKLVDDSAEPLALVRRADDMLEVTVSVAIAADSVAASAVAAAVAEAVHDVVDPLGASDAPPARVRVRVSRVLTGPRRGAVEDTAR